MPDGVSVLGSSATNLYPSLTTKVGVFDGCTKLTNLDLNNVIRIGGLSFRNCPLTEVADTLDPFQSRGILYRCICRYGLETGESFRRLAEIYRNVGKDSSYGIWQR